MVLGLVSSWAKVWGLRPPFSRILGIEAVLDERGALAVIVGLEILAAEPFSASTKETMVGLGAVHSCCGGGA